MIRKLVLSLGANQTASAAVEFALIGPLFLTMFMGVMQVGIGMQNYNALRSISADTARYAVVNYQRSNLLTPIQLQTYASNAAKLGNAPNRSGESAAQARASALSAMSSQCSPADWVVGHFAAQKTSKYR